MRPTRRHTNTTSTNTTSTDTTSTERGTIAVGDTPSRFEVRCANGRRRTVAVRPDFAMASEWSRALKRIHHVELRGVDDPDGWTAWLHGTGHRTPTRCRISVPTAVALGLRHVPVLVSIDGETAR